MVRFCLENMEMSGNYKTEFWWIPCLISIRLVAPEILPPTMMVTGQNMIGMGRNHYTHGLGTREAETRWWIVAKSYLSSVHAPPVTVFYSPPSALTHSRLHSSGFTPSRPFTPRKPRSPSTLHFARTHSPGGFCQRLAGRWVVAGRGASQSHQNILASSPNSSKPPAGERGHDASKVLTSRTAAAVHYLRVSQKGGLGDNPRGGEGCATTHYDKTRGRFGATWCEEWGVDAWQCEPGVSACPLTVDYRPRRMQDGVGRKGCTYSTKGGVRCEFFVTRVGEGGSPPPPAGPGWADEGECAATPSASSINVPDSRPPADRPHACLTPHFPLTYLFRPGDINCPAIYWAVVFRASTVLPKCLQCLFLRLVQAENVAKFLPHVHPKSSLHAGHDDEFVNSMGYGALRLFTPPLTEDVPDSTISVLVLSIIAKTSGVEEWINIDAKAQEIIVTTMEMLIMKIFMLLSEPYKHFQLAWESVQLENQTI
ncbi:hypothetical protein PR048_012204 [Dryococelus australis]|uniref:Uncharacterized protein n=1 Tax=Dryococelus australis TaxID=614101 RepID=A0ABQ9HPZ3_9NEOP|nr:hypothetical protein PR048_012204 [Dryococelus australis]